MPTHLLDEMLADITRDRSPARAGYWKAAAVVAMIALGLVVWAIGYR